jgi:cytochrome bd-type quinol oxidase subunit 1
MTLDPVILSRLQFFWVVSFHILLPAFTVGLACYIAVLEGLYLNTKDHAYFRISVFWTKIFAISFGLGVVSGIVMPFQFGTNWSRFSDTAANVIGPLMAYEGLTAFFLEASFLGVLLFGRKLVPPWAHFFAAAMVAVGTLFSSFWILALNSWMNHQPAKLAAMEGHWETQAGAPFILFGWPDQQAEVTRWAVEIPYLGSLILTHEMNGTVRGLKEWRHEDRPPAAIIFWSFRIMVGIGLLMLLVVATANWLRWKGRLYDTAWFLRICEACLPLGFAAVIAGWITTEVGRQPWVIYGLMRTTNAVTPSLTGVDVLASLMVYVVVYLVVYPVTLYYMVALVRAGPISEEGPDRPIEGLQRPLPARAAAGVQAAVEVRP